MSQIPECVNFVKKGGCWKSDVILVKETEDAWAFKCRTCSLLQVVSKDGVQDKSKFELAAKRKREAEEAYEARMKRRKIFA